jgi:hypothetical protein
MLLPDIVPDADQSWSGFRVVEGASHTATISVPRPITTRPC